jgi:hypothetical protein
MSFTTSGPVRMTWRLDALDPAVFARMFKCSLDEARRRFERARRDHSDPEAIRAAIDGLSAAAPAALCVLVTAGGAMEHDQLIDETARRFGFARTAIEHALVGLMIVPLIVPLASGPRELVAVLDVVAQASLALVGSLDIPSIDRDTAITQADDHDEGRGVLAICMALCHVELKVTQAGAPHRAGLKRLAKQLGVTETLIEEQILAARELGLVRIDMFDVLRSELPRIASAAAGRFPHRPEIDAFMHALREANRPVPLAAVTAWMSDASRADAHAVPAVARDLARLPGVRRGRAETIEVFEACSIPDAVAATITPSFEVFLPPETRFADVVDVLACAELARIDRVLVARITKASVRRALAAGATAETILANLKRASRTPLPQNVEASVVDWAGGATHATLAFGRVVAVPAEAHDRTAAALEPLHPQVVARGVFVIEPEVTATAVTRLLDKAGISERRSGGAETAETVSTRRDVVYPQFRTPDRALQRRIEAFRAGDPQECSRGPEGKLARAHDDTAEAGPYLEFTEQAIRRVERWERDHERLPDDHASMFAALYDVAKPVDREFLLGAKNFDELMARIQIVLAERDGFIELVRNHRGAFEDALPGVLELLEAADESDDAASRESSGDHADLDWIRRDMAGHLFAAERTQATLVLDFGAGDVRTAKILRIAQQGRITMLLAEDVSDGSSIAVPVTSIRGIAEPSPVATAAAAPPNEGSRVPWRPFAGQAAPPGHAPCPCGSGRRYRSCCRPAAMPS